MFPAWRLKLREARLAFQGGRFDEAGRLLERDDIREFLPAKVLAQDVAAKFVTRAEGRLAHGDTSAGWHDLATALRLGGQEDAIDRVRQQYAVRAMGEVRRFLAAGQPGAALERLAKLQRKGLAGHQGRVAQQIAELMVTADKAVSRGRLTEAATAIGRARPLVDDLHLGDHGTMDEIANHLNSRAEQTEQQADQLRELDQRLHTALSSEDWSAVLTAADAILAIAPQHTAASQARRQAWKAVGMDVTRSHGMGRRGPVSLAYGKPGKIAAIHSTRPSIRSAQDDTVTGHEQPRRNLLWIDSVGGFLVCYDDVLVLGQPTPDVPIAVPILADLSRRHAVIRRDGGAYTIEPVHTTYLDGRELTGPTLLAGNQVIQLGDGVRLRFHKPHALSSTARLTIESLHKTQPSADAIIMMAESCLLGPRSHCHVRCPEWQHDVILFRRDDGLMCRAGCELRVDDEPASGPVAVLPGTRIEGDDFSFSIEEV